MVHMTEKHGSTVHIVVGGDIVTDHHIYEGQLLQPSVQARRGVRLKNEEGGAAGVYRLQACLFETQQTDAHLVDAQLADRRRADAQAQGQASAGQAARRLVAHLGTLPPPHDDPVGNNHAFAVWRPFPRIKDEKDGAKVWRIDRLLGYGDAVEAPSYAPHSAPNLPVANILVLDDAGQAFRRKEHSGAWLLPAPDEPKPSWIFLKTADPVCEGDLWHKLVQDYADRLVCVVSARDLRREHVKISSGLSWERTIEELRQALETSPVLAPLKHCRHLIVTFSADGALRLERPLGEVPRAMLCYDAAGFEGGFAENFTGQAVGYLTGMAVAIVRELACDVVGSHRGELRFDKAIGAGLSAMRMLLMEGHGEVGGPAPDGFPVARVAQALLKPGSAFAHTRLPWDNAAFANRPLSLIEVCQRPLGFREPASLLGVARQVVIQGMPALDRLPHARFGHLITAQREEIEALRNIRTRMIAYRDDHKARKPLSIGVFGPPGAGKSFGVKEIANALFGESSWLEFNLSQFEGQDELLGAFHNARDLALAGRTPVVFWDEFDSRKYYWLQYLLAPMQDGRFQERQLNHAVGRGIFIFAGGTSPSFAKFSSPSEEKADEFRLKKGPDFCSRLDAYYDVFGPNQRRQVRADDCKDPPVDPVDNGYCLRRALFIRAKLAGGPKERLNIDPDLLDALLLAPDYKYGARSLEKLLFELRPVDGAIRRSSLPPPMPLGMHVNANRFLEILDRNAEFRTAVAIESLAAAIHASWRSLPDRNRAIKPHLDRPYSELGVAEQEDNRDAARRIPEVLALVGLGVARHPETPADEYEVEAHLDLHLDLLAEAVHDGWMRHKLRAGWRYATMRDDRLRLHDTLVPFAELDAEDRNKDRQMVLAIPALVQAADFGIIWL